jgi:hypothetical protein
VPAGFDAAGSPSGRKPDDARPVCTVRFQGSVFRVGRSGAAGSGRCRRQTALMPVSEASGQTYVFVNTATRQQIQVECSADPRRHSGNWWKSNCRPLGGNTAAWAGAAGENHPDFLWVPTGPIGSGAD